MDVYIYVSVSFNRFTNLFWPFMIPEAFLEEENKVFWTKFCCFVVVFSTFNLKMLSTVHINTLLIKGRSLTWAEVRWDRGL